MQPIVDWLARASMILAALCFAGFLLMIVGQVGYRYLGISMVFSEEAARLLNIYAVFLGLVCVVHASGDVRINMIDGIFGDRPQILRALQIFYNAVAACFLLVVLVGSYLLMESNWLWPLPSISFLSQGHIYLAPFIGSALSLVIVIFNLFKLATHRTVIGQAVEDVE